MRVLISRKRKHKRGEASPVAQRTGNRRGIRAACLLAALVLPLFLTIYNDARLGAVDEPAPRIEGGMATDIYGATPPVTAAPLPSRPPASPESAAPVTTPTPTPEPALSQEPSTTPVPEHALTTTSTQTPTQPPAAPIVQPTGPSTAPQTVPLTELPDGPAYVTFRIAAGPTDETPAKVAYITIDDGPSRAVTPGMLDVLKSEGVPATFFVLPNKNVDDLFRRIIDEGHEIGNHSFNHSYAKLYQSGNLKAFTDDVLKARNYILENFGYETVSYRFPGGTMGRGAEVIGKRKAALEEMGYRYFNWHIDSGDARSHTDKSATALTNNVLNNTRDREHVIILMHDSAGRSSTLKALPMIIEGLRKQGYTFDILRNYPQE